MSEPESPTNVSPTSGCRDVCPRHAFLNRLVEGGAWLVAALVSLLVAGIPYDDGEAFCGVWGCFPPFPALAAMHLFWCVAAGALVRILASFRPCLLRPAGIALMLVSAATGAAVIGIDLFRWFDWSPEQFHRYWLKRTAFTVITSTDIPFVQVFASGLVCFIASRRRAGGGRGRGGRQGDMETRR